MRNALFSRRALGLSLLAILLIAGCLKAALWQYHRGVDRHAANALIIHNIDRPALSVSEFNTLLQSPHPKIGNALDLSAEQWRTVSVEGVFDANHEIFLRNRYIDGQYGFGVLTLFRLESGENIWIDRGWVKAGKDATTPPQTIPTTSNLVTLEGRLRTFSRTSQIRGSFFALPGTSNTQSSQLSQSSQLGKWNAAENINTANFSLDLLRASDPTLTPRFPNELPELSDGPHMAYALQWLVFALLVLVGRVLIVREDLRLA